MSTWHLGYGHGVQTNQGWFDLGLPGPISFGCGRGKKPSHTVAHGKGAGGQGAIEVADAPEATTVHNRLDAVYVAGASLPTRRGTDLSPRSANQRQVSTLARFL